MAVPKTAALPLGYAPIGPAGTMADEVGCIAIPPVRRKPHGGANNAEIGRNGAVGRQFGKLSASDGPACRRMAENPLPRHRTAAITPRLQKGLILVREYGGPASSRPPKAECGAVW